MLLWEMRSQPGAHVQHQVRLALQASQCLAEALGQVCGWRMMSPWTRQQAAAPAECLTQPLPAGDQVASQAEESPHLICVLPHSVCQVRGSLSICMLPHSVCCLRGSLNVCMLHHSVCRLKRFKQIICWPHLVPHVALGVQVGCSKVPGQSGVGAHPAGEAH